MGLDDVPRCQHVKVNGTQCGSPALRRKRRCYFHEGVRVAGARANSGQLAQHAFELPVLEDANAVQVALMQVMQMLVRGQMEAKIAGLLLYGLQTASANIKNTKFEAEKATDVVIDCDTVEQTCINGPQWFSGDFVEHGEAEETEMDEAPAPGEDFSTEIDDGLIERDQVEEEVRSAQVVPSHVIRSPVCRNQARPNNVGAVKRKKPGLRNLDDEPPSLAKILLQRMGLPPMEEDTL
jgi:hypothetical protein